MVRDPVMVEPGVSVGEVARLMRDRGIGSVILVSGGKPVGIVTERDLVHRVMAEGLDPDGVSAFEVCSRPVVAISVYGDVDDAVDTMSDYRIRRLVVLDGEDRVVGVLTTDDLCYRLRSMSEDLAVKYVLMSRRRGASRGL